MVLNNNFNYTKMNKNLNSGECLYTHYSIRVYSGQYVNLLNPDPDTILIEDIAHGLSMKNRWGGHTIYPYSVAQHSVFVSDICRNRLEGLLHDATEAYLSDLPSPAKKLMPDYIAIENRLYSVIAKKFGIPEVISNDCKDADRVALVFEWENIVLEKNQQYYKTIEFAKQIFLQTFKNLTK